MTLRIAFIFDEIVWRLIVRNVGITSTLKNYVTMSSDRSVIL